MKKLIIILALVALAGTCQANSALNLGSQELGVSGVLDFDSSLQQRFAFPDTGDPNGCLDNWACGGYLLAAVLNYDSGGYDIISKAEASGFFMDRNNGEFRFGVHTGGAYKITFLNPLPLSPILDTSSYLFIGAFDGHGPVHFWSRGDGDYSRTSSVSHVGATQNDYELLIGADPGASGPGSFFDGKLQRVSLLAWGRHPVPPDLPIRYDGQVAKSCSRGPHIDVEMAVNAIAPDSPTRDEDADSPPGQMISLTAPVTLTYLVTNPGDTPLDMSQIAVRADIHGSPGDPLDDLLADSVDEDGNNVGDTDLDGFLDPGEAWQYRIVSQLPLGARSVEAIVDHASDPQVSDCDRSHYHVP